ncbi:hypothetical protein Bequi_01305 [Brachybacterium sp. JHP9]|uniref:Uncharacterized protein n=1 Tax=Brachybacterium equifaecis TaxID=2910770 RepID=A0ABT0QWL7_9MICO|nr:hypothetical protein [Brachybacterium equifaecis]MCL6422036.1 hypothetical protein [Brachybacterium equifaecis]
MSKENSGAARERALQRAAFPWERVSGLLGLAPAEAAVALRDDVSARDAVLAAARAYIAADDDRRAGRAPSSPVAAHPDFPTGVGMSLIGASVLWEAPELIPQLALRVAKDHFEDGDLSLAASFAALVAEHAQPGRDDAEAWSAQSLLVAILSRAGSAADADALARDLAAHGVPVDLWRDADPRLPDESMAWHGGAFVEGMPPRADGRALSFEQAGEYVDSLLTETLREHEAEEDPGSARG